MDPLASRRVRAHLTDCVGYLGLAAATAPVGVLLVSTTSLGESRLFAQLVSAVPPVAATLLAARAESGPHRATWGKRRQGLEVAGAGGAALPFSRALGRNTVKILVPWQLGHLTAIGAVGGGFEEGDALTYGSAVAVYAALGVVAATVLRRPGRGVHDRLVGGRVLLAAAPRG
ncbi:RDD family protein [Brachybacterium saurashtrense]|uniref:RDD domain-containing protein n=1 Tax=Brachybacterium saurashtrense TaxID=556288 RepID=A0A345YPZ8_9MICO|nr:RDD family protein [Brachybacterium saurashtrense]AXK46000.1 hypothetical protein DWV08_10535 [Brachybacterium saurashtrense]RRR23739.1 hypothetical protein DXU92_02285 [Brachybacterium saurashtrense]